MSSTMVRIGHFKHEILTFIDFYEVCTPPSKGILKLDFWVLEGRNRLVHIELRFKVSKSGPSSV